MVFLSVLQIHILPLLPIALLLYCFHSLPHFHSKWQSLPDFTHFGLLLHKRNIILRLEQLRLSHLGLRMKEGNSVGHGQRGKYDPGTYLYCCYMLVWKQPFYSSSQYFLKYMYVEHWQNNSSAKNPVQRGMDLFLIQIFQKVFCFRNQELKFFPEPLFVVSIWGTRAKKNFMQINSRDPTTWTKIPPRSLHFYPQWSDDG